MKCHKCGREMLKTPCCPDCGIIPVVETDFRAREQEIVRLRRCLECVQAAENIGTAQQLATVALNKPAPALLQEPAGASKPPDPVAEAVRLKALECVEATVRRMLRTSEALRRVGTVTAVQHADEMHGAALIAQEWIKALKEETGDEA